MKENRSATFTPQINGNMTYNEIKKELKKYVKKVEKIVYVPEEIIRMDEKLNEKINKIKEYLLHFFRKRNLSL